jgi:hypothetical protein
VGSVLGLGIVLGSAKWKTGRWDTRFCACLWKILKYKFVSFAEFFTQVTSKSLLFTHQAQVGKGNSKSNLQSKIIAKIRAWVSMYIYYIVYFRVHSLQVLL